VNLGLKETFQSLCKGKVTIETSDITQPKILSRGFILCFFAQFTFQAVFTILVPTLPIYISRFQAKEAEIGVLIGVFSFSSLILRPFVGKALLNIPEKKFMIAGTVLYVFSSAAYLLAPPFWPLLAVRIFQGIGLALFNTAVFTLVANIAPEVHRGQLTSYFYLSGNLAYALGPYFGMVLINRYDFIVLFLACTGLSLCALFITMKLDRRDVLPVENQTFKLQNLLSREALPPSIIAFMLHVIWGAVTAFFPLYALRNGVSNPGIFFVFTAMTLILSRAFGGKILDIYDRKKVAIPCLTTIIISLTILTFSTTLPMFILVAVGMGIGWALLVPSLLMYVIENAGSARGPAMGTYTGLADLGTGVGPMIMGIILQWTNYTIMFFCLTLIGVINLLYFYFAIWKKRGRRDQMATSLPGSPGSESVSIPGILKGRQRGPTV
jgi:MFS family permease